MGVNIIASGRKIYSVPKVAGVLKGSIREILKDDARVITVEVRNLDEVNQVTIKPVEGDSKTSFVDLDANSVATLAGLGATAGDTLTVKPLGRGTMKFSIGKRYWALNGSGGPGLIEVREQAQNWSPVEGHGDQS